VIKTFYNRFVHHAVLVVLLSFIAVLLIFVLRLTTKSVSLKPFCYFM